MFKPRRHHGKTVFVLILFAIFSLTLCGPALASEGSQGGSHGSASEGIQESGHAPASAEGGHGGDRTGDLIDLLYRFINFALMVIILWWALKKARVKDFLTARIEEIRQRLENLKKAKEDTQNQYNRIEKQLRDFEQEKKQIIEEYRKEGEAEKAKIISEAEARVRQIIEQAEMKIRQEIQAAKGRLKDEIVDLATQKAEEIVKKNVSEMDQDLLVDEFIERVGGLH